MNTRENAEASQDTNTATETENLEVKTMDSSPPNEPPPSKTGYPQKGAND